MTRTDVDALVARYWRDGFVHVPAVLTPDDVAEARSAALDAFDATPVERWESDSPSPVPRYLSDPGDTQPALARVFAHPGIVGLAIELAGTPLRLFSSEILTKRPGDAPTPAHADHHAVPVTPNDVTITAWIALVDVPVGEGCLRSSRDRTGPEVRAPTRATAPRSGSTCPSQPATPPSTTCAPSTPRTPRRPPRAYRSPPPT